MTNKKIEFTFEYYVPSKDKNKLGNQKTVNLARNEVYKWFQENKNIIVQGTLYRKFSILWNFDTKGCLNLYNKEERKYVDLMKEKNQSDFEFELARLENIILD